MAFKVGGIFIESYLLHVMTRGFGLYGLFQRSPSVLKVYSKPDPHGFWASENNVNKSYFLGGVYILSVQCISIYIFFLVMVLDAVNNIDNRDFFFKKNNKEKYFSDNLMSSWNRETHFKTFPPMILVYLPTVKNYLTNSSWWKLCRRSF